MLIGFLLPLRIFVRFSGVSLVIAACSFILGCGHNDDLEGRILDYRERLERTLEADFPELAPAAEPVRYPTRKALQRSTTEFTINWLDFFAIMDCDLNRLIGQRNSSLGKMMSASQRWRYEQEFLIAGQQCLEQLQADGDHPDMARQLESILKQKREDLTTVAWNATWAGPEFQKLMSFHDGSLAPDFQKAQWAELTAALGTLAEWCLRVR